MSGKTFKFEFSHDIAWKADKLYILPEVNPDVLFREIEGKILNLVCYGGLLESFFSLCLLEYFHLVYPTREVYWSGNEKYHSLLEMSGLGKISTSILTKHMLIDYPVPLFFDKQNFAYFNLLNNYVIRPNIFLQFPKHRIEILLKQIFENFLIKPWSRDYIPKLRNFTYSDTFNKWINLNRIYLNKPYVLIIPDNTNFSIHKKTECLNWSDYEIKAFAAILRQEDVPLIVCTDRAIGYGNNIYTAPIDLNFILPLIINSSAILSKDLDFLILSLFLSKAKLFFKCFETRPNEFDMFKHAKFIGARNEIHSLVNTTPKYISDIYLYNRKRIGAKKNDCFDNDCNV